MTVTQMREIDAATEDSHALYCEPCDEVADLYSPEMDNYNPDQHPTCDFQHKYELLTADQIDERRHAALR